MITEAELSQTFPNRESIPAADFFPGPIIQSEYLINGELRTWSGPVHEIYSPVHLKEGENLVQYRIGSTPALDRTVALEALQAAVSAYDMGKGEWPTMTVSSRIRAVENFAKKMAEQRTDVVRFIMWEIGKNKEDSEKEFDRTVDYIRDTVNALKDQDRSSAKFLIEQGIIGQIRRAPLGVVLCMGPYNYPLNETFATLIPALVMGNTCVFKPPKLGVLLYRPLLAAFRDCFPKGVINTIYGSGEDTIPPIMETGDIDVLAFIGSARVADSLKKVHPHPHKLRGVLGLGAKNPAVVLADADIDQAVSECVTGSLSYNGQRCTALKILFVHRSIVDVFLEKYIAKVSALKPGMPWDAGVKITPLPVPDKSGYLASLVSDAVSKGAKVVNPGGGISSKSLFFPAVLYPVSENMRAYQEEQFGPVVPIVPFDDLETPMKYIYHSHYGQQLSVFGKDPDVIGKMIDPLVNQVSRVNLNSQCQRGPDLFPFTGRKGSAEGTLSVSDALRAFSIRSLFAAKDTDLNKAIITEIVHERKSNFLSTDFIF